MILRLLALTIATIFILSCSTTKEHSEIQFDPKALFTDASKKIRKGEYEEAREALKKIQEKDVEKNYAVLTQIRLADSYYDEGSYEEAITEYKKFLTLYPFNKYATYVQYQTAMSYFRQIEGADRNAVVIKNAIAEFEKLKKLYPRNPYKEEIEERLRIARNLASEYEFYVGHFYYKKGSYKAATGRFEVLLKEYPKSPREADALYYLGLSYKELGNKEKASNSFRLLLSEYPDHRNARDAKNIITKLQK
ncbi:MAG: outer membrane protein assembly factor BamD [Nitrospirota bacterium]